ncbi:MAG: hypothetical protein ACUVUG_06735 [Candidatus Aminicenantia bacterium]
MKKVKGEEDITPFEQEDFYRKILEIQRKDSLPSITAGVIHDLNNVISIIIGYIEFAKIQLMEVSAKVKPLIEVIEKAS